jgi:hypothetical protein
VSRLRSWSAGAALAAAALLTAAPALAAPPHHRSARAAVHPIPVRVFDAGGPTARWVAGAPVRVVQDGRVIGRGRTGPLGLAVVRAHGAPHAFRVVADLPGGGHYSADVVRRRPVGTVFVNPVTTVADRVRRSAGVSRAEAARRTRNRLGLPAGFDLATGPRGDAWFDGRRFLKRARTAGGREQLLRRVVAQTARSAKGAPFRRAGLSAAPVRRRGLVAHAAQDSGTTASSYVSSTGSALDDVGSGFDGLSKIAPTVPWLAVASGWGDALGGLVDVGGLIAGLFGATQVPTPTIADAMQQISQSTQQLQSSINNVATSVQTVEAQLRSVDTNVAWQGNEISNGEMTPLVARINQNSTLLENVTAAGLQVVCQGQTVTSTGCASPSTAAIDTLCPAATVISWSVPSGTVVYPAGWQPNPTYPAGSLAQLCSDYYTVLYGEGGFVSAMTGTGGGSAGDALGWPDLETLTSFISGTPATVGVVAYSSNVLTTGSRFMDSTLSSQPITLGNYYIALYATAVAVMDAFAGAIQMPQQNLEANLSPLPMPLSLQTALPSPVPEGTVLDTSTGIMWNQDVSLNVPCAQLTPASSPIAATPQCPSTGAPTAVTDPMTVTPSGATFTASGAAAGVNANAASDAPASFQAASGATFTDWYGAGSQYGGLFANAPTAQNPPPAGLTSTGWLATSTTAAANNGAGMDPAIFGSANPNVGSGMTVSVNVGGPYAPNLQVATVNPNSCSAATTSACGVPTFYAGWNSSVQYDIGDLNNDTNGTTVFNTAWTTAFNVLTTQSFCANMTQNWALAEQDPQLICTDMQSPPALFSRLDSGGWVTLLYRNPGASGAADPGCYYWLAPSAAQGSSTTNGGANTSACPSSGGLIG